jgi:hypothetical protein
MSEVSVFKPTNELIQVFGAPALVGEEKLEVYNQLFSFTASSIRPVDPIGWILTKDVTDLLWDIRRERYIKTEIVRYFQKQVVAELIKSLALPGQLNTAIYRIFQSDADLMLWETDAKARAEIDAALEAKGHRAGAILAQAYMRGAAEIDAIDRRIAGYERRRDSILREAGLWNEHLARNLDKATTEIVDAEFTEAAGEN